MWYERWRGLKIILHDIRYTIQDFGILFPYRETVNTECCNVKICVNCEPLCVARMCNVQRYVNEIVIQFEQVIHSVDLVFGFWIFCFGLKSIFYFDFVHRHEFNNEIRVQHLFYYVNFVVGSKLETTYSAVSTFTLIFKNIFSYFQKLSMLVPSFVG